jgi:hypothetical protein
VLGSYLQTNYNRVYITSNTLEITRIAFFNSLSGYRFGPNSDKEPKGTTFRAKIFDISELRNASDCIPALPTKPARLASVRHDLMMIVIDHIGEDSFGTDTNRYADLWREQRRLEDQWYPEVRLSLTSSLGKVPSWCGDDWVLYSLVHEDTQIALLRCSAGPCFEQQDPNGHVVGKVDQVVIDSNARPYEHSILAKALSSLTSHASAQ